MPRGGKREGAGRKAKPQGKSPARRLNPEAHAGGRPTSYDPAYCEQVVECMRAGFSLTGFAGTIGVARSTLNEWADVHPEFLKAIRVARAARLLHWEESAIRVAARGGGPGTAQIITFALKNMAPEEYSDTQKLEHTGKDGTPLAPPTVVRLVGAEPDERSRG